MTDSSTAVITISHSGSTTETVLATRLARDAGARTIGITRLGRVAAGALLRHRSAHHRQRDAHRPEAMSSRVAQLA